MGRGDKRTKRGKIFAASFGNTRKRKAKTAHKTTKPATSKTTSAPAKKAPAKKASK